MSDNYPYAISSVEYTDTDGNKRKRIVVDIPAERWDDYFKHWKEWNARYKSKSNIR